MVEILLLAVTAWVNPFVGTEGEASFNPAAIWPNGMLQPGPVTSVKQPMHTRSYRYHETTVVGFDLTRGMGTWWPSLHDILIMPFTGEMGDRPIGQMDKRREFAEPGYYSVELTNYAVRAEMTVAERVAFQRYTPTKGEWLRLYIDLGAGPKSGYGGLAKPPRIVQSDSVLNGDRLTGHNVVKCYVPARDVFFVLQFSQPPAACATLPASDGGPAKRYVLDFQLPHGRSLVVRAALSGVDAKGAEANLNTVDSAIGFDDCRALVKSAWECLLDRTKVEGDDRSVRLWYSMLYQLYAQPMRIDDADGRVRISKDEVIAVSHPWYTGFLDAWDTFRSAHPFYTILTAAKAGDFARTLVEHARRAKQGTISSNLVFGHSCRVMGGNYGVVIALDAWEKGLLPEYSPAEMLKLALATHAIGTWDDCVKKGYYPFDGSRAQLVSVQLDNATTSQVIAEFARRHGLKDSRVAMHAKRGTSWRNLYDCETGWLRPRRPDGSWYEPFNPFDQRAAPGLKCAWNEGGCAQWSWMVLCEPEAFVELHGGSAKAAVDLDRIFKAPEDMKVIPGYGCTGQLGQYYHGNEPTHHMPYYYLYMNRGDRTDEIVRDICTRLYAPTPTGICGDCDSGQLAAWYLMSATGLCQFKPVGGEILLGAPQLRRVELTLDNRRKLVVVSRNLSEKNRHVASVSFNGRRLAERRLAYKDLMNGGELVFEFH